MVKNITLFCVISLLSFIESKSQRLLTEDYNFNSGQLTDAAGGANVSGGSWQSISGTGKYIGVVDGSLSLNGYVTNPTANSRHILIDTTTVSAEDVRSNFAAQTSGKVYCSFLVNVLTDELLQDNSSDTAEYFMGFLPSTNNTGYQARVFVKKGATPGTITFGISANSYRSTPISWIPNTYALNSTHLITFSTEFIDGEKNDIVRLWVDQPSSSTEPVAQAISQYTSSATVSENNDIGGIAVRQSGSSASGLGSTPRCRIDAIKVSTQWFDATFPVTLKTFTAALKDKIAFLKWITTEEVNMKEYVIERKTGNQYETIGQVPARNIFGENDYSFNDVNMLAGLNLYRLKLVDNDGSVTYSQEIGLTAKVVQQFLLRGNLVSQRIIASHSIATKGASIKIISATGTLVQTNTINAGAVQTEIIIDRLMSGTYYAVFENNGEVLTQRFVKQ
jgi:hypothetical protein